MHNIYFNGKAGKDCNLFVSGEATFDAPEKEVERVSWQKRGYFDFAKPV